MNCNTELTHADRQPDYSVALWLETFSCTLWVPTRDRGVRAVPCPSRRLNYPYRSSDWALKGEGVENEKQTTPKFCFSPSQLCEAGTMRSLKSEIGQDPWRVHSSRCWGHCIITWNINRKASYFENRKPELDRGVFIASLQKAQSLPEFETI